VADSKDSFGYIAVLKGKHAGQRMDIGRDEVLIGRDEKAGITLARDHQVSRRHCVIRIRNGDFCVEDLGSANGTFLNGKRVRGIVRFEPPSYISVGQTWLAVMPVEAEEESAQEPFDSTSFAAGSILVPQTYMFHERTEAFLVVDIMHSTEILQEKESRLPKIVSVLAQILNKSLKNEQNRFLKCTGDGFFACFSSAQTAADVALTIAPKLKKYIKEPVQICIALHWGTSRLTEDGDRTGRDVHCVFDLQVLRHRIHGKTIFAEGAHELILMTEIFRKKLDDDAKKKATPVGQYRLKGLEREEKVYMLQR